MENDHVTKSNSWSKKEFTVLFGFNKDFSGFRGFRMSVSMDSMRRKIENLGYFHLFSLFNKTNAS